MAFWWFKNHFPLNSRCSICFRAIFLLKTAQCYGTSYAVFIVIQSSKNFKYISPLCQLQGSGWIKNKCQPNVITNALSCTKLTFLFLSFLVARKHCLLQLLISATSPMFVDYSNAVTSTSHNQHHYEKPVKRAFQNGAARRQLKSLCWLWLVWNVCNTCAFLSILWAFIMFAHKTGKISNKTQFLEVL